MEPRVSVLICTRNRPDELRRCLDSVRRSGIAVFETIVADDSTNADTEAILRSDYPWVRYVPGPRRGLGANRNRALGAATGDFVLFLDDDACLGSRFLEQVLAACPAGQPAVITGREDNRGHLVRAHDQSFLGFQNVPYPPGVPLRSIVINSTLWPRSLFAAGLSFDENLVYGYDEVDVAAKALAAGFQILPCDAAVNSHFPSLVNRDYYRPYTEASRLYVTVRRYALLERRYLRAAAYCLAAPLHCLAAAVKRRGLLGARDAWLTVRTAAIYLVRSRRSGEWRSALGQA